ncbi:MAG: hypothetical protein EAZ97_11290 [Bacteroidetes bacterium]|nr:MAG: hypothetical protein EAZ97_11290 [Bacteroidota bacterium]
MKNILKSIFFLFLIFAVGDSFAQKNKKEEKEAIKKLEKEWKKKKMALSPEQFKTLIEQQAKQASEANKLKKQIEEIGKKLEEQDNAVQASRSQIDSLRSESSGRAMNKDKDELDVAANPEHNQGKVFKVQIGVVKKINGEVFEEGKNYSIEKDTDGRLVYTLGNFRDFQEAKKFQEQLKKVGLKETHIVLYNDNVRNDIQDVQKTDE